MGSIQVRYEKDRYGHKTQGPYAYYIESIKVDGKFKKKKTYIGKVPRWYVPLFSRETKKKARARWSQKVDQSESDRGA